MADRHTYEFVKESFENEGYTLFSDEYKNNSTKMYYICSKGHEHNTTWANWNAGYRCPYCAGQGKPTIEEIKKSFEKENYILITREYKNSITKLKYICPEGHKHSISWAEWRHLNNRCPYCSGNIKSSIIDVRSSFEYEGYILLSDKYKNSMTKLDYICPNGHKHSMSWNNWSNGRRCPSCAGNVKHSYEFIKSEIEKEGYKLLSKTYKNAGTKLKVICEKGHKFTPIWNNWRQGKRCPICPSHQSKFEKEISCFLDFNNIPHDNNNRTILVNPLTMRSLELDIVFTELNKAIECNGKYWHSRIAVIKRDIIKKRLCYEKGIGLLVVEDEDWYNNKEGVSNKIINFLNEG